MVKYRSASQASRRCVTAATYHHVDAPTTAATIVAQSGEKNLTNAPA